jgi:hypothetical protein
MNTGSGARKNRAASFRRMKGANIMMEKTTNPDVIKGIRMVRDALVSQMLDYEQKERTIREDMRAEMHHKMLAIKQAVFAIGDYLNACECAIQEGYLESPVDLDRENR